MTALEYRALRKIPGAYQGASHHKLSAICRAESLDTKVRDMLNRAVHRLAKHGDPLFVDFLAQDPSPNTIPWHQGPYPGAVRDSTLARALTVTGLDHSDILSRGDRNNTTPSYARFEEFYAPEDKRSETKAYWATNISQWLDQGWRTAYTDGTGTRSKPSAQAPPQARA